MLDSKQKLVAARFKGKNIAENIYTVKNYNRK